MNLDKFGYVVTSYTYSRYIKGEVVENTINYAEGSPAQSLKLVVVGESTREEFLDHAAFMNISYSHPIYLSHSCKYYLILVE